MRKMGKLLAMCSLFMASVAANSACVFWMYQDENEELKRLRKFQCKVVVMVHLYQIQVAILITKY